MTREEDDTWDLATSVGMTATIVAVGRALASRSAYPLIHDAFADPLVRAVGVPFFTRIVSGDLDPEVADGDERYGLTHVTRMMAARTRLIDDFFADAGAAGIRQIVILAAGLDARAYRLPWPAGTVVYEVDQPAVMDFKTRTMEEIGAVPTAHRRTVAIDLRHDWVGALKDSGFDPLQQTAWSAEGLVHYLPGEAQDRLLDNVTSLSAPGSRFIVASVPEPGDRDAARQRNIQAAQRNWRNHGFELEVSDLWYVGDRHSVAGQLGDSGWYTRQSTMEYLPDSGQDGLGSSQYVTAVRHG